MASKSGKPKRATGATATIVRPPDVIRAIHAHSGLNNRSGPSSTTSSSSNSNATKNQRPRGSSDDGESTDDESKRGGDNKDNADQQSPSRVDRWHQLDDTELDTLRDQYTSYWATVATKHKTIFAALLSHVVITGAARCDQQRMETNRSAWDAAPNYIYRHNVHVISMRQTAVATTTQSRDFTVRLWQENLTGVRPAAPPPSVVASPYSGWQTLTPPRPATKTDQLADEEWCRSQPLSKVYGMELAWINHDAPLPVSSPLYSSSYQRIEHHNTMMLTIDIEGRCWSPPSMIERFCEDFHLPFEVASLQALSLLSMDRINNTRIAIDIGRSLKDYLRRQAIETKKLAGALPSSLSGSHVLLVLIRQYLGDGFTSITATPTTATSSSSSTSGADNSSNSNSGGSSSSGRRRFKGVPFLL